MKRAVLLVFVIVLSFMLRLSFLTMIPPSLHGDEMGVSYNAHSLLTTGLDEYGKFLPITFRNDLTPLDVYLTIPWVALFGLTEFSTRIHSVVIGIITILASYKLGQVIFGKKVALLTAFLLATLPWHIHTSRIGLGVNSALYLQIAGVIFFLKGRSSAKLLHLSFFAFGLSTYAYHAPKLTAPLLLFALLWIFWREIKINLSTRKIIVLFTVSIIIPTIIYFLARPIKETRFAGINVLLLRNSRQNYAQNFMAVVYWEIIKNYFNHFDPRILFFDSGKLKYFQIPNISMFYSWELPFLLLGTLFLVRKRPGSSTKLVFTWIFIAPLASALTIGSHFSHFNRVMLFLPVIPILISLGMVFFLRVIKLIDNRLHILIKASLIITVTFSMGYFLKEYFKFLPTVYAEFWGVHIREAVEVVLPFESNVAKIVFTNQPSMYAQTYMYVLFYTKKNPTWLTTTIAMKDKTIGYANFGIYEFRSINWKKDSELKNAIIVGTLTDIPTGPHILKEIQLPNGQPALRIAKLD